MILFVDPSRSEVLLARAPHPFGPLELSLFEFPWEAGPASDEIMRFDAGLLEWGMLQSRVVSSQLRPFRYCVAPDPVEFRRWAVLLLNSAVLGSTSWLTSAAIDRALERRSAHTSYSVKVNSPETEMALRRVRVERALIRRCSLYFAGKEPVVELEGDEVVVTCHSDKAYEALRSKVRGIHPWLPRGYTLRVDPPPF